MSERRAFTRRTLLRRSPAVLGFGAALQFGLADLTAAAAAAAPAETFTALMEATDPESAAAATSSFSSAFDGLDPITRDGVASWLRRVETEAGPRFATLPASTRRAHVDSALKPLRRPLAPAASPVAIETTLAAPLPPLVPGSDGCDVEADVGCVEQIPTTRPDGARSSQTVGAILVTLAGLGADLQHPKPGAS